MRSQSNSEPRESKTCPLKRWRVAVSLAAVLGASVPVLAHHGYSAYEMDKEMTLSGVLTDYQLVNPHGQFAFDVKSANGQLEHWVVECSHTVRGMRDMGLQRDTFKAGDAITITFHPSINGTKIGVLISIAGPDGKAYKA